jgi:uncharacterized protein (DUF1800 family)
MKAKAYIQRKVSGSTHITTPGGKSLPAKTNYPLAPVVQRKEAYSTGLPRHLKSGIENLSGMSMDHVKVHYNSSQPAQLNALAYAQGSDIHIGPGQEKHLPHEAWHVAQQLMGRVKPAIQMKTQGISNDSRLECEADVMGARAAKQG